MPPKNPLYRENNEVREFKFIVTSEAFLPYGDEIKKCIPSTNKLKTYIALNVGLHQCVFLPALHQLSAKSSFYRNTKAFASASEFLKAEKRSNFLADGKHSLCRHSSSVEFPVLLQWLLILGYSVNHNEIISSKVFSCRYECIRTLAFTKRRFNLDHNKTKVSDNQQFGQELSCIKLIKNIILKIKVDRSD